MKSFVAAISVAALLSTVPTQAAQDMGLQLSNGPAGSAPRGGIGAQAGVTLRFGDKRIMRASEKVTLGIVAGPMVTVNDRRSINGFRRGVAGVAGVTLRPGYSASFAMAGQPLITQYTRLGAAEAERGPEGDGQEPRRKKGPSTVGWVAIGLAATAVVVVGAGYFLLVHGCGGTGCSD